MSKIISSGIRKKYLKYITVLLILALFLSSVGVSIFTRKSMTKEITGKYIVMTEKMGSSLDNLYKRSDEVTAECILNQEVQNSLYDQPLDAAQKGVLKKYFTYVDLKHVEEFCYIDNKDNVYARPYTRMTFEDFEKSGFKERLGGEYSKTKWFWAKDTLFGTGKKALFIGRYIRNMEYSCDPGMLFFKMGEEFLQQIIDKDEQAGTGVVAGIMDEKGELCALWPKTGYEIKEDTLTDLQKIAKENQTGMIRNGEKITGGVLSVYRQETSGMLLYTFVPDPVFNKGQNQLLFVLAGVYLFVITVAVVCSVFISRRFTKPIQYIAEAMAAFDGNDFNRMNLPETNTELDMIGQCYNKMLGNIEKLLREIKEQEKELRTSELNMLISQINPHFLYNTLDTIYMLARINKEETTMHMIQALSKYLRLSLSKGSDIVTLEDELENVRSYMEIQQIRNENLFSYEIDCQVKPNKIKVLKLILQPLVENAIKYGFHDIFEGGKIMIRAKEDEQYLILNVCNNGTPMEEDMIKRLNGLISIPFPKMKDVFPDKQHGYGVVNIATRLRLKYGEYVQYYYIATQTETNCVIKIPKEGTKSNGEENR